MFFPKLSKVFKGIRFRLALVYSTLFGLFICIFAYILTSQYIQAGRERFDSALLNYAIDLASDIKHNHQGLVTDLSIPAYEYRKKLPFAITQTLFLVRDLKGQILVTNSEDADLKIPYNPELSLRKDYTHRFLFFTHHGTRMRGINMKIRDPQVRPHIIQVAASIKDLEEQEYRLILVNALMIPFLIIISSIAGYVVAGNALSPVQSLAEMVNKIAATNLSLRIKSPDTEDEISNLAHTFNMLLDRLETAFKAQEHFVANASHQLNTPLSIIKGELEVLESKSRSPEEIEKFHRSLKEELDRLITLVKNLLMIARVEAGQEDFVYLPQRVDEILLSTTERLHMKAREKKINIRFNIDENLDENSDSLVVLGEKQLLDSLFENILENAIKYSPEESVIKITMSSLKDALVVSITDEGPGIDEDQAASLFTRFQRGSGHLGLPGTGIGLSIAAKIAKHHKASIKYNKLTKGSEFSITFALPHSHQNS